MESSVLKIAEKHFKHNILNIESLGGGFYGRVFSVKLEKEPFSVVVKLYLFDGFAENEALQLETLSKHSVLKMPDVYDVYTTEETGLPYDALLMEFLDGINAGWEDVSKLSEKAKTTICENVVDNLIAFHSTKNEKGFGELSSDKYYSTWQGLYRPKAQKIVEKARELHSLGQISNFVLDVFERSFADFDKIFYLPITEARLIHGDYNTWNVMLNHEKNRAEFVIDPFGCCFGDSEYDLYQLDNANGKEFGLLKRYAEKIPLTENFLAKRYFYELYSEISHYHDARVPVDLAAAERMAKNLSEFL